jgi:hypothetical protein
MQPKQQLILISRITSDANLSEFAKYTDEGALPFLYIAAEGRVLFIINGILLDGRCTDNSAIISEIFHLATNAGLDAHYDTIIAYHYGNDLTVAIQQKTAENNWTAVLSKKYSSANSEDKDKLYPHLTALGETLKSNTSIDTAFAEIWSYFLPNNKTVSNENLLQPKLSLLTTLHEGIVCDLPPALSGYATGFDAYKAVVGGAFDDASEAHLAALRRFRDILLAR